MLGRIDELAKRLFSFFVSPLLNVIIISLILRWCLSDQYSISKLFSQLDFGGVSRYLSEVLTAIVSGNFDALREFLGRYSSQIAAASTIAAIILILTIVLVMFLLDRAIYYVSWLVPQDIAFDFASYGVQRAGDERIRRLYGLIGQPFDFATAYGAVSSYLGEQSTDQQRIIRRNELMRAQGRSRAGFEYALSYCCLVFAAWLFSIVRRGYFDLGPLSIVLIAALLVMLGHLIWHAHACRSLVEYDIDSFIRLRLYDQKEDRFVPVPAADPPAAEEGVRPLRTLYLRSQPAGILYEAWVLLRGLFTLALRRK